MAPAAVRSLGAAACATAALLGCSVDGLDLTGKSCPCPPDSELVCDKSTDRCVASAACTPRFTVSDFGPTWTTPDNVRWEWEPLGSEDTFGSYAIEVSRTAAEIESGAPQHRLDQETHAELGRFALLNTGEVNEVVRASVTYGLDPDTSWYARLVAVDRFGCAFESAIVPATTLPEPLPGREVVLFEDAAPDPGQLLASSGTFAWRESCDGDPCLECVSGASSTDNLRLFVDLDGAAFGAMSPGQFEGQAFLEFRVWLEDPSSSFWTSIWVESPAGIFRFEPYSPIRTPAAAAQTSYLTVQLPLRELLHDADGAPMTHQQLTEGPPAGGLVQFSFGTIVPEGTRVWLDDIRVRW